MAKIKAKPGFNVQIKDIGVRLNAHTNVFIEVPDEIFNNSVDAKKVMDLLVFENDEVVETLPKAKTVFVANEQKMEIPQGIFVAQPEPTVPDVVDKEKTTETVTEEPIVVEEPVQLEVISSEHIEEQLQEVVAQETEVTQKEDKKENKSTKDVPVETKATDKKSKK